MLTEQSLGFDGQYNWARDSIINVESYCPGLYVQPLHELLYDCTNNDPSQRPNLAHFADRLDALLAQNESFRKHNPLEWEDVQRELFPFGLPDRAVLTKRQDIMAVLDKIAQIEALGHVFFPDGGGMHLEHVGESVEENCMEIKAGIAHVVNPKRLIYESFGDSPTWNYFRLETNPLSPIGEYDFDFTSKAEELTEVTPGLYTYRDALEFDDFEGERLPKSARSVARSLSGDFVIFAVISPYNLNPGTYDARHDAMGTDEFRAYIERIVHDVEDRSPRNECTFPRFVKPQKKRQSVRKLNQRELALLKDVIGMARDSKKGS